MVPIEAGNDRGGTEPWFRVLRKEWTSGRLVMSLTAQIKLEEFREKLYVKAKTEPAYRFYDGCWLKELQCTIS